MFVLQCMLQYALQYALQCLAVRSSVLQCVAVCCSGIGHVSDKAAVEDKAVLEGLGCSVRCSVCCSVFQ